MRTSEKSELKVGRKQKPLEPGSTFLSSGLTYQQLKARAAQSSMPIWDLTCPQTILTAGRARVFSLDTEEVLSLLRHLCNRFNFRNQSLYLTHPVDTEGASIDVELYLDTVEQLKQYHSRLFWLKAFTFFALLRANEPISFGGIDIFVDIDGRVTPLGDKVSWSKINQNTDHFFVGIDPLYQSRLSVACLGIVNFFADAIESAFDRSVFIPQFKDLARSLKTGEEIEDYFLSLHHLDMPVQLKKMGQLSMAWTTAIESTELPGALKIAELISDSFYSSMSEPSIKKPLLLTVA